MLHSIQFCTHHCGLKSGKSAINRSFIIPCLPQLDRLKATYFLFSEELYGIKETGFWPFNIFIYALYLLQYFSIFSPLCIYFSISLANYIQKFNMQRVPVHLDSAYQEAVSIMRNSSKNPFLETTITVFFSILLV